MWAFISTVGNWGRQGNSPVHLVYCDRYIGGRYAETGIEAILKRLEFELALYFCKINYLKIIAYGVNE